MSAGKIKKHKKPRIYNFFRLSNTVKLLRLIEVTTSLKSSKKRRGIPKKAGLPLGALKRAPGDWFTDGHRR